VQLTRVEEHLSFTFENNIVYWTTGPLYKGPWIEAKVAVDRNLYWNAAGKDVVFLHKSFAEWKEKGYDLHSVIADPGFINPEAYDFRLRDDSPAHKIGFTPFDTRLAGVQGDADFVALANSVTYPAFKTPPKPRPAPPLEIHETFENRRVGDKIPNASYHLENKGDSIDVTDQTAASGTMALRFQDAEGLRSSFNPHLTFEPDHREGKTRCSFDIRLDAGASFQHEWREYDSTYVTGPMLHFRDGGVYAHNQRLMDVPVDQWFHVEVSAELGDQAGTWDAIIQIPGQDARHFTGIKTGDHLWKRLTWLGFISQAVRRVAVDVDNLKLINTP